MSIPTVSELLLEQAIRDAQEKPDPAVAMGVGATGGALIGALAGTPAHMIGMGVNNLKASLNPQKNAGQTIAQKMQGRIRPGFRAAGGLVGAIAGGALGAGMANAMRQSSPAGEMLARIQATNGDLNAMEKMQLESILKDYYNNMG